MAAVLLFWNTNMAAVTSREKSGNKDLRSHLGIRTFNPCFKCIEIIDCCRKHSMMQFHGFLCIDISSHATAQDTQQKLVSLTASGFIMTNAFPVMSAADYGENLGKHVFLCTEN